MKNFPYREAVGSLMYAAMGTRPDITFAVSIVSQFNDNPGRAHWEAVKHIDKYLHGTKNLESVYGGDKQATLMPMVPRRITAWPLLGMYSWSMEELFLGLRGSRNLLRSPPPKPNMSLQLMPQKKQCGCANSSGGEVFRPLKSPTTLFSDSKSVIVLAQDGHYHARTKHIDLRYHYIRYIMEAGSIKLIHLLCNGCNDGRHPHLPSAKAIHFARALLLSSFHQVHPDGGPNSGRTPHNILPAMFEATRTSTNFACAMNRAITGKDIQNKLRDAVIGENV
jgi:hypothetical protein